MKPDTKIALLATLKELWGVGQIMLLLALGFVCFALAMRYLGIPKVQPVQSPNQLSNMVEIKSYCPVDGKHILLRSPDGRLFWGEEVYEAK